MVRQLNLSYDNDVFLELEQIKEKSKLPWNEVVYEALKRYSTIKEGVN